MYFQNSLNGSIEFYYNMIMSNLPTVRMGVHMAYGLANHITEHGILKKFSVAKDWKQFCQETLCEFLDNSPKILRLVKNNVFLQIHEKVFL